MYNTVEVLKEMLNIGMIDQEEYNEYVSEYSNAMKTLQNIELVVSMGMKVIKEREAAKVKEMIEERNRSNCIQERAKKIERLCNLYAKGIITMEEWQQRVDKLKPNMQKDGASI